MPYDSSLFNTNPYYDDFNEDKKFLRMLFRPGYAVQSRELTQLQTILQNQIEKFGNHIFKDGSRIVGGEISTYTLSYVRLQPTTANSPVVTLTSSDVVGYDLVETDSNGDVVVRARVVDLMQKEYDEDSYAIAVVSYLTGGQFSEGTVIQSTNPDKIVSVTTAVSTAEIPCLGDCKVVATNAGIYYVNGFFVKSDNQFQAAYNTTNGIRKFKTPTGVMGFDVQSQIITEADDYTLKDPASGNYNYNAPGSHRYKINLELSFVDSLINRNFIELVTYADGSITKKVEDTEYSDLIRLFAQRTFDESGNYVVRPFDISFRNDIGNTFFADLGSGKAYIFGYEYETKFKDTVSIPKARTEGRYADYTVDNYFGNYVLGTYDPTVDLTQLNSIYTDVRASIGENTTAPLVYGASVEATGPHLSNAVFSAKLVKVETNSILPYSTQTTGTVMDMRAYVADVIYKNTLNLDNEAYSMNLYLFDPRTNVSYKLLKNVRMLRDTTATPSLLPVFYGTDKQSLVYSLNGNTPSTMVKSVDKLSYIHDVFRGFVVSEKNPSPSVPLAQGVEFDWCLSSGFVPSGSEVNISDTDGYYLIYASGSLLPIGTMIKIVSPTTIVPSTDYKITAKIDGDGDTVSFTSAIPYGSYYLVGKSRNRSSQISTTADPATKIRAKTLTQYSETITNQTNTIDTFKRVIVRNTAGTVSSIYFVLNQSDVYNISSIVDGFGKDISNQFLFDNGQRDAIYDLARLHVKPEYLQNYDTGKTFQIVVSYSYFTHSGYGPFLRESYVGITYDNIPVFVSPTTEKTIHLANAIDYRYKADIVGYNPSGATEGSTASAVATVVFNQPIVSYSNGFAPTPFSIIHTHNAYLPRIDKIVVSKNISNDGEITTLQRIAGVPSDFPIVPEDLGDSMTLFVLSIPAYTFNATDVKADSIGNSRYTMKDIGSLSKRVDDLEQFAVLNELELDVASRTIRKTTGANGIKSAILVDTFDGHSIADVSDADHRCSIDLEKGELRPSFSSSSCTFKYAGTGTGLTLTSDNILCADYTKYSSPVISQTKASTTIKVNSFNLPNWVGNIRVTPSADTWFDRGERPVIKSNPNNVNDGWLVSNMNDSRGYGTQWNDWESLWTGVSVEFTDGESSKNAEFFSKPRTAKTIKVVDDTFVSTYGIQRFTISTDKTKNNYINEFRKKNFYVEVSPNTIINKSISPYIRDKKLALNVYNMKPKVDVHIFFDNVNVNQYCVMNGATGPFTTDAFDGSLSNITFSIPQGMFEVGEKIIRVIDDPNNIVENATTIAEIVYHCTGIKEDDYLGVSSIRPAEIRKKTPNSSKIISNPLYPQKNLNTSIYNQWIDPLTQTFEISESSYPNGLYMESVDLFLASKDDNLPISIEICPTVNGVPNSSVIVPFSTVVKNPSGITANANTPQSTNFKFTTPVYLSPGTYGLVVKANTSKYSLFAANIGDLDITTNERISSSFANGALFKPQNSADPQKDVSMDIMFNINRCNFSTLATSVINLTHLPEANASYTANIIQPSVFAFTPPGVSVNTKIKLNADEYNAVPNRNLYLPSTYTITPSSSFELVVYPSIVPTTISTFMIDMDRTSAILVENLVNSSDDNTQELSATSGKTDSTARYISKKVTLPKGKIAYELKVIVDANLPQNTFIKVYGRTFNSNQLSTTVNEQTYRLMSEDTPNDFNVDGNRAYSLSPVDFREVSYTMSVNEYDPFDTFSVKICMYSSDQSKVPSIKNLRIVALQ